MEFIARVTVTFRRLVKALGSIERSQRCLGVMEEVTLTRSGPVGPEAARSRGCWVQRLLVPEAAVLG